MAKAFNSLDAVIAAIPAVQEQARLEIAARLAAGETIAGREQANDSEAGRRSLTELRKMLVADQQSQAARAELIALKSSAA